MTDVLLLRDRGAEAVKKNLKFCQQANLNLYNTCTEYNVQSNCRLRSRCVGAEGMARFHL